MEYGGGTGDPVWCEDARKTVTVFGSTVAIVLGCIYLLLRSGFQDDSIRWVGQTVPLSLFLLSFSTALQIVAKRFGILLGRSWLTSDAALSLAGLAAMTLSGLASGRVHIGFGPFWGLLGLVSFLFTFWSWVRKGGLLVSAGFLGFSCLFGVWVAGAVWGWGWQNPLFEESLLNGHHLCRDIFLPASVSSMIKTYGVASFGVDGLVYCYYHWGAYWIFAQISRLIDVSQLNFGQLCFPVIFIPFFLSRLIVFAIDVREHLSLPNDSRLLRQDFSFWLLFCAAFIGFVPNEAALQMMFGLDYKFISETYTVALGMAFATLSMGLSLRLRTDMGRAWRPNEYLFICLVPLLLLIVGLTKVSLIYLLCAIFAYVAFRVGLWRHFSVIAALGVSAVAIPVVVKLTVAPGESGLHQVYPLGAFISNVKFAWKPLWPLLYFFWSWLFIAWRIHCEGLVTVKDLVQACRSKRTLDIEVVALVCLVGLGPSMLLAIPGASGLFFTDFQTWFSLAMLLGYLAAFRQDLLSKHSPPPPEPGRFRNWRLIRVAMFLGAILMVWATASNAVQAVSRMVKLNLDIRYDLIASPGSSGPSTAIDSRFAAAAAAAFHSRSEKPIQELAAELAPLRALSGKRLRQTSHWKIVEALRELALISEAEKSTSAIYIPRANRMFWTLSPQCEVAPFIVPSITGIVLLGGSPDADCASTGWGLHYSPYRNAGFGSEFTAQGDEGALCARAMERGFSTVIVVEDVGGRIMKRSLNCRDLTKSNRSPHANEPAL